MKHSQCSLQVAEQLPMGHKHETQKGADRKMRKWVSLALATVFITLMFAGCSNPATVPNTAADTEKPSVSPDAADQTVISPDNGESEETKILIAYFSRSGNTKQIADMIHEQRSNARPTLTAHVDNMDDYDIVFVGHPIWWGDMPMAVLTFLEEYDFTGKTVIPFCTYGSSGSGRSISSIKSAVDGASVLDGFSVRGSDANKAKGSVTEWLKNLSIFETSVPSPLPTETNASDKKVESGAQKENVTVKVPNNSKPYPTPGETNTIHQGTQNNAPAVVTDPPIAEASTQTGGEIRIRLTFSGGETVAVLEDNPTTQSLLAQLPITVTFDDFANAEKIAYFPEDLSTQDAPNGHDPQIGDVACYGPWGNIAFFYKDQPYASGLIPMGRVESGLEKLIAMKSGSEVKIEQMK